MHFAFSTVACPTWDFQTIAARAKDFGYDAVEIRGFISENVLTAANVFLSEPAKVRDVFASAGVKIACLSTSIAYHGQKQKDSAAAADLRRAIDVAAELGCPLVKVADTAIRAGVSRSDAAAGLAAFLAAEADRAAERRVSIAVENLLSFRTARELWMVLEMAGHPSIGACWDVAGAAQVGEQPFVSVPVLNSRILHVHVKDATFTPLGASFTKLGEGQVRVKDLLGRLRGIGYAGTVSFEWDKAWLKDLPGEPEEVLPAALAKLKEWTTPPAPPQKPAKHEKAEGKPAAGAAAPAAAAAKKPPAEKKPEAAPAAASAGAEAAS